MKIFENYFFRIVIHEILVLPSEWDRESKIMDKNKIMRKKK